MSQTVKTRISDTLASMLRRAIERDVDADQVDWDFAPMFHPQNPPVYFVSLAIPGAVIGTSQMAGFVLPDVHHVKQEFVDNSVKEALNALREARSQALQQVTAEGGPKELILPR